MESSLFFESRNDTLDRLEAQMRLRNLASSALLFSGLLALGCAGAKVSPAPEGGIQGQVLWNGTGAAGAYVYAYTSTSGGLRGPSKLVVGPTGSDGRYAMNLAPGSYYVIARKRLSGSPTGNLGEGDLESVSKADPISVAAGAFAPADLSIAEIPGRFLLSPYSNLQTDMGITGRVLKSDGTPAAGAYIMAYTRRDRIGRPLLLAATDPRGEYALYPPKPGTYYIAARGSFGDLPRKGEPYGTYDDDPEHKVELQAKTILKGIDVKMDRFTRDLTKCAEH